MVLAPQKLQDEAHRLSAPLPPLLVAAHKVAATVMLGVHGRRRAGTGDNFWAYRPYSFGDSTQRIDWHKSGKADQAFIREKEWEAANTLWVWTNTGARMNFKSHLALDTKLHHAQVLSLAMAQLALRGHERVGYLGADSRASYGRHMFEKIARQIAVTGQGVLPQFERQHRFSSGLFVSDFLDEPEFLRRSFAGLAEHGMRGHLVLIADPAEEGLPYEGRVEFLGLDLPQRFQANKVQSLRQAYQSAYQAQREAVKAIATTLGWTFTMHRTDQPLAQAVLALHTRLNTR